MAEYINDSIEATVDDNGSFVFADKGEVDAASLAEFMGYHIQNMRDNLNRLMNYYRGKHDYANYAINAKKAEGKPDARIVVNYPQELTDNMTGFFVGTPPKITYQQATNDNAEDGVVIQDKLQRFLSLNQSDMVIADLAKQCDVFGYTHLLLYQDEMKETRFAVSSPIDSFVIYDDSVAKKPICGVRYKKYKNQVDGIQGTIYYPEHEIEFTADVAGYNVKFGEQTDYAYSFGDVPLIEFKNNGERLGTYESVMSLIDSVDEAMSHKANDINYFANEILKLIGVNVTQKMLDDMINNRVITVSNTNGQNVDIGFLDKPNADGIQENFLNRVDNLIYTKSGVANFNDDVFGNASGVALEFKLQAMTNKAKTKERYFTAALLNMLKQAFNVGASLPQVLTDDTNIMDDIDITFSFTVPHNLADEAKTAQTLMGITDQKTALSVLSNVKDPQQVIDARKAEEKQRQQDTMNAFNGDDNGQDAGE